MARDAWAEAREEGHGHVSAGLTALRAVAERQAKELDQGEIKQRLARIAGRELGADQSAHDAGADAIRDRLKQVLEQAARTLTLMRGQHASLGKRPVKRQ